MSLAKLRNCLGKSSLPKPVQVAIQREARRFYKAEGVAEMTAAEHAVTLFGNAVRADLAAVEEAYQEGEQGFTNLQTERNLESGQISPEAFAELVQSAVKWVGDFASWAADMVRRFGEAVKQYLQGAWQAAKRTSEVGAVNISAQPQGEGSAEPAPGFRFSEFSERIIDDPKVSPELQFSEPEQFQEQPQQETMDKAAAIIKEKGRKDALAYFKAEDTGVPLHVREAGLFQLMLQFDTLANLEKARGNAPGSEEFDSFADMAVEAKAAVAEQLNRAGLALNIANAYARMSPEGVLRRFEKLADKAIDDKVRAETGESLKTLKGKIKTGTAKIAKETKEEAREKAITKFLDSLKPKTRRARQRMDKVVRTILKAADADVLTDQQVVEAIAKEFGIPIMTPAQREEFADLATDISLLPEGSLRQWKVHEFQNKLALFQGIPANDALLAMWYANILSGLSTQGVNLWGNGFIAGLRTIATMLGSGSLSDSMAMFKGMTGDGVKRGLQEMRNTWRDGLQHKTLKMDDGQKLGALELLTDVPNKNFGQWLAYVGSIGGLTKYVFRTMGAVDALFWHTAQEGRAHIAVNRTLRKQGLKPGTPEFNAEFIRELGGDESQFMAYMEQARQELAEAGQTSSEYLVRRRAWELKLSARSQEVQQQSDIFADRVVSQQKPEGIGNAVTAVIGTLQRFKPFGVPVFVPLLPFNRIVSNLLEGSLDFAGVGILRGLLGHHLSDPKGRQFDELERRERMMAGVMGLTVAYLAWALAQGDKDEPDEEATFMIYGFGPKDKNRREQMPKGWKPFTIKMGDTFVNYAETPVGMLLAGVGSWMDSERYEKGMDKKSTQDRVLYSMLSAIRGFSSQGVLSSIGTTMDVLTGQENPKKLKKMVPQTLAGLIPTQGMMRDVSTLFDDTKIDDNTFYAALVKDVPVLKSEGTRPSINIFGDPVKIEGMPVVRRFLVEQRPDPVSDFIGTNRLHVPGLPQTIEIGNYLGSAKAKNQAQRIALQMTAIENGVMTPDQRYAFAKRSGELTKEAVMKLRQRADGPIPVEKREAYQKLLNKMVESARKQAMLELVKGLR